jgi:DNA sulfur modification protein DndB
MTTTTTTATELDLSAGSYVKGVRLSETAFLAATSFQQLRTITRDPDVLQPGSKRGNDEPGIEEERAIHELIQRAMAGNKKSNVPRYTRYIEQLVRGEAPGVLPPIDLWSAQALDVVTVGATTYILVPNGEHLLAIDGETQLAAHHALGRSSTVDSDTRSKHQKFPLAAVLHHGVPSRIARQYFHDLNILAVRPNTSLGLAMDTQDPVMQVVSDVESRVELLDGRVEKMSRQLPKKSLKIVTLQSLRQMVVNIAKGISGVQYGARPAPVADIDLSELTSVAVDWIGAFFGTFENEIAARETHLAGSGPVLAAVGAMGHNMLKMNGQERNAERARLLRSLRQVDWSKDAHWVGIAGNFTATGVFSVKGTKEVAYAVYNALTDFENTGYGQIHTRTPDVPALQPRPASES